MKQELINKTTRVLNKTNIKIQKHSPEILLFLGITGVITSTVIACKRTLKVNDILEEKKNNIELVNKHLNDETRKDYTEKDSKKDLAIINIQTGMKIVKLYSPAVLLGTASILSILQGHNILKKRNIAIAAAYATIDNSFKKYRSNVVERFGKNIDNELRYNIKAKEIEEETTDEKGKKKIEKKEITVIENNQVSDYARFFDECSTNWEKDAEYNLMFLRRQQEYANELLKSRGHLFLNEVYDMLGIQRSKAGQVVGWIYDTKNPKGDNYVDFNIYNIKNEANRQFVNGEERSILLDFNVDGVIYDLI